LHWPVRRIRACGLVVSLVKHFPIKYDPSGRALLNLACGSLTDWTWNNLDFSPYATLRHHSWLAAALYRIGLLSLQRWHRLEEIDPDIIRWNLANGIPFPDNSFDVVYHSHFLEHIDPPSARKFLLECHRVLKPGGTLRVVVPDLELLVNTYCEAIKQIQRGEITAQAAHQCAIYRLFDQMVRNGTSGAKEQKPWVRRIERLIRGSASTCGETHRWMYDQYSLGRLLGEIGFEQVTVCGPKLGLEFDPDGRASKPNSLYLEAKRP